jgi:hypothetical protein
MDVHERQQFDFLMATAVERYVERLEQRNEGAVNALARLRQNPEHDGVRLGEFVAAVLADFLLDNADGACFVLRAVPRRTLEAQPPAPVGETLRAMAAAAFAQLLRQKTEEMLEQHTAYASAE